MKTPFQHRRNCAQPSRFLSLAAAVLLMLSGATVRAHEDKNTHPALTVGAILFLDQYFPEDGQLFSRNARTWIRKGSIDEDECPNYVHHFFNPKTGENSTFGTYLAKLQLDCPDRLANLSQQTAPQRAGLFWSPAIDDYQIEQYENAFLKLGYILHLLQDMTSPAHVHGDFHGKAESTCGNDGDDFEMWGFCSDYDYSHIRDYVSYVNITNSSILPRLADGLTRIFNNQPQTGALAGGEPNIAYATVRALAHKVYDFTTFQVKLVDTSSLTENDPGEGELKRMFPLLVESQGQWEIPNVGYSIGECNLIQQNQEWWLMETGCDEYNQWPLTHVVEGHAYIENTGGGTGSQQTVPDTVIPRQWERDWFSRRYGTIQNTNTVLRVYGDVLYSAAVTHGAGLLQAFLDQAIMPKPVTQFPTVIDGNNARLNGRANPGGEPGVAWFEWGIDSSFSNATTPQLIASGTTFLPIADSISGLIPETTYHYRLVSSNIFGIRRGRPQTLRTLNFALAGGGLNAWQITDDLTQSGSTLSYTTNLSVGQRGAAISNGWRFAVTSRLTTDFGGARTMAFLFGHGAKRFVVWWDLDVNGDLTAFVEDAAATPIKLTSNAVSAKLYHTHEINYANGTATYSFDGAPKAVWSGSSLAAEPGLIYWGAGSSAGMGQMNFHDVHFEISGLGLVASYAAGTGGNPAQEPNPATQGWTRRAATVTLVEHSIAPDGEPFVPAVETLSAGDIAISNARLTGQANPHGNETFAWFEWGLITNYQNRTPLRALGAGQTQTNVSVQIGALESSTVYHYRLVASNDFGVRFGNNQTFQTPSYLITGNLPNAWQITDDSAAPGTTWNYSTNLTPAHRMAATNNGWRYTVVSRLLTNFGTNQTMNFLYGTGPRRFIVWWNFDTNGNLTSNLPGLGTFILTTNQLGATLYHTHELRYNPTNRMATYWFDGNLIASWLGEALNLQNGQVYWGAGSSAGMGQMNFRQVEFQVGESTIVAAYDAGAQDNPAPDPVTRGWTISQESGTAVQGVAGDLGAFLPAADTLLATTVGATSAQFNGHVNSGGQETATWFEWGTRTSYGNRTAIQNAGAGFTSVEFSNIFSELSVDTTYHFRVVASNSLVTAFGQDQTLRTIWFSDTGINLPSLSAGSTSWGDYDNDGDLDLLVTGQTELGDASGVYRNDGDSSFAQVSTPLIGVYQSSAVWGDYDRDGDLDILLSGLSPTGPISHVYRNDRTNFTDINAGLPGVSSGSVAWVDYDNDGDLDILLTGADAVTNRLARIYRNDSGTNFININASLAGTSEGTATSGDFDGDGDHDFVLTGLGSSGTPTTRYYRNDGGVFTDLDLNLPGVYLSSLATADYDGDGDLDLLLSGASGEGELTRLFRNVRNGATVEFEEVQTALADVSSSSVAWGDFDNDGDPDIILSGWRGAPFAAIYRNDVQGTLVPLSQDLPGTFSSSTAWADADNDGDLDLLLTGRNDDGAAVTRALRIYRNQSPVANTAPTAPSGLTGSGLGDSATVSWQPASDNQTSPSALTYNLVLSSDTNEIDLASPMANVTDGYRRVAQFGGAGHNLSWTFTGLNPGTYYFSVQAIDSAYSGGAFAPRQSFEVAVTPVVIITCEILQPGRVRIHFAGSADTSYEVWGSPDLQTWTSLGLGLALSPGEFEYIDGTASPTQRFYQVRPSGP